MSGPATVLHVLARDALAGTEIQVAGLLERIDPAVVRCEMATLDVAGPIAARMRVAGIPVYPLGGPSGVRTLWRLAAFLWCRRDDVVVAYGYRAAAVARLVLALRRRDRRLVVGIRGQHLAEVTRAGSARGRGLWAIERITWRLVDVYDANSPGALEPLAAFGVPRARLRCIPNGLDLVEWPSPPPRAPGGQRTIVSVARFAHHKRHADLVHAFATLQARGLDARLVLPGDGPELRTITALVRDLGLENRVSLPGLLDRCELRDLLLAADVFALVSESEGMPGTVMEAMACGLPVVGTRVNGTAALVADGETGLLVELGDRDALEAALETLLADPDRRARMGARGRQIVEAEYGIDRLVAAKQRLYLELAHA
jgi:glycosyltransferase involved in cell wall biosynthesis